MTTTRHAIATDIIFHATRIQFWRLKKNNLTAHFSYFIILLCEVVSFKCNREKTFTYRKIIGQCFRSILRYDKLFCCTYLHCSIYITIRFLQVFFNRHPIFLIPIILKLNTFLLTLMI